MSTRSIVQRVVKTVVVVTVMVGIVYAVKIGRKYVFLDNFGTVTEGAVYRSGQLKPYQLKRVIEEYGIKTVINTREAEADSDMMTAEREVCRDLGVNMVRIMMPGDGKGTYGQYDWAVSTLAEETNLPALVHCARGTHRTGAIVASYRVLIEGMPINEALDEMEAYRFDPEDHPLVPHLSGYLVLRTSEKAKEEKTPSL